MYRYTAGGVVGGMSCAMNAEGQHVCHRPVEDHAAAASDWPAHLDWMMAEYSAANRGVAEVGRCTLNQVDPYPITYNLSNP